jgi:hypothetical protein
MTARYDNTDGRMPGRRLRVWSKIRERVCRTLTDFPAGLRLDHKVPLFKGGKDSR